MQEIYAEIGLGPGAVYRHFNKRVGNLIRKTESEWIDSLADLLRTAQACGHIDPTLDARC